MTKQLPKNFAKQFFPVFGLRRASNMNLSPRSQHASGRGGNGRACGSFALCSSNDDCDDGDDTHGKSNLTKTRHAQLVF